MENKKNTRETALSMLVKILEQGQFSHEILREGLKEYSEKQDRSFLTRLVMGTVERALTLDYQINRISKTKTKKMKPLIRTLLRMSAYQILYMESIPDSAVCNEAVKLAKKKGFVNLSGFVNGVLRNLSRQKEELLLPETNTAEGISIQYSCPLWLVEKLISWYGMELTRRILSFSENPEGISVRMNLSKAGKEEILKSLGADGIEVEEGSLYENGLLLHNIDTITTLDAFWKGYIQPQDESSMLVGAVAAPVKGSDVLDLCAAPGGKSIHVADLLEGTGQVLSQDVSEYKLHKIQENIDRCQMKNIKGRVWDATQKDAAMLGTKNLVIADLPCSGLGVLGKKADIKYSVTEQGLEELVQLQREILKNAVSYLAEDGVLVYSTCTIHPEENTGNVQWLLEHYDLKLESISKMLPECLRSKDTDKGYLQLLQGVHPCDGFFIARFRRGKKRS